jgi:hypothetical protein
VKPDINFVEVHPHLSHHGHPVDSAVVPSGPWELCIRIVSVHQIIFFFACSCLWSAFLKSFFPLLSRVPSRQRGPCRLPSCRDKASTYCAGNIWTDLITISLTGGACSLRWISWNFRFPTVGFSTLVVVFSVSPLVHSCQFLCQFVYWIEDIWIWISLEKALDPALHILCAKLFFYLDQVGSNSWVNVGHSPHNMLGYKWQSYESLAFRKTSRFREAHNRTGDVVGIHTVMKHFWQTRLTTVISAHKGSFWLFFLATD